MSNADQLKILDQSQHRFCTTSQSHLKKAMACFLSGYQLEVAIENFIGIQLELDELSHKQLSELMAQLTAQRETEMKRRDQRHPLYEPNRLFVLTQAINGLTKLLPSPCENAGDLKDSRHLK